MNGRTVPARQVDRERRDQPVDPVDDVEAQADLERKVSLGVLIGIPAATVLGAALVGAFQGPPGAVLVLAGGALIGVIAIFWASVRTLFGETPLSGADAFALGSPRVEEEQKRAVLRALKDLEFERSVGKISDEDYADLVSKYRGEAKRLLRVIEEEAQPKRAEVESLVQRRLKRAGLVGVADASPAEAKDERRGKKRRDRTPTPPPAKIEEISAELVRSGESREGDSAAEDGAPPPPSDEELADLLKAASEVRATLRTDRPKSVPGPPLRTRKGSPSGRPGADDEAPARLACAVCSTENDADAVFCKKCGARQLENPPGSGDA